MMWLSVAHALWTTMTVQAVQHVDSFVRVASLTFWQGLPPTVTLKGLSPKSLPVMVTV
jgi:hypothetical protein